MCIRDSADTQDDQLGVLVQIILVLGVFHDGKIMHALVVQSVDHFKRCLLYTSRCV